MKHLLTFLVAFTFSLTAHSFSLPEWAAPLKNVWERFFPGETNEDQLKLPTLPGINRDSRSTSSYERKEAPDLYTEEERMQFNYSFIREIYQAVRNQRANRNEEVQWMSNLGQGGSREGLYRALVLDNTYAAMEEYGPDATVELQKFVLSVVESYIGIRLSESSLQEINFFTLKRLVTDYFLEMTGELLARGDDLYTWYAVLSGDLARRYSKVFDHPVRGHHSDQYHFHWAKEVPTQHLKSEIILKLHLLMNHHQGR